MTMIYKIKGNTSQIIVISQKMNEIYEKLIVNQIIFWTDETKSTRIIPSAGSVKLTASAEQGNDGYYSAIDGGEFDAAQSNSDEILKPTAVGTATYLKVEFTGFSTNYYFEIEIGRY